MFTGIIEEVGTIKQISVLSVGAELVINCSRILEDINIGDSICVNGVCQTVTNFDRSSFEVMLSSETLNVTNFSNAKKGDYVNLERALCLNKRLGGHIVSGHVDSTGKINSIKKLSDFYDIEIELSAFITKYIVYKGSITINGISLTVAKIIDNVVTISVIPHTYENTNLKYLKPGSNVNIETDMIAKYVEKLLVLNDNTTQSIGMDFLKENGFV